MITMPAKGIVLGNKYLLLQEIGRGGMGIVFLARHQTLDSLVAVKILLPEFGSNTRVRDRFINEAKRHARLKHNNIVAVQDAEFDGKFCYFVMEYVDGIDLGKRIKQGPLGLDEIKRIVLQISSGLKYVHDQKLVHRDIKPSNIILEAHTGRVVITDFGICKSVTSASPAEAKTQSGEIVGTLEYMPPEQFGKPTTTIGHDIYAFGLLIYEMLTRVRAFDSRKYGMYALINQINSVYPAAPSSLRKNLPTAVDQVIRKAIDKNLALRYETATALYQAFAVAVARSETPVQVTPLPRNFLRTPAVYITAIAGSALVLLVIIIICAIPPAKGYLRISSTPMDVQLRLDDGPVQEVTLPWGRLIAAGRHRIIITRFGAVQPYRSSPFTVSGGDTVKLDLTNRPELALKSATPAAGLPVSSGAVRAAADTIRMITPQMAATDLRRPPATSSATAPARPVNVTAVIPRVQAEGQTAGAAPQSTAGANPAAGSPGEAARSSSSSRSLPASGNLILMSNVPVRFWADGNPLSTHSEMQHSMTVTRDRTYVIQVVQPDSVQASPEQLSKSFKMRTGQDTLRFRL